MRTLQRGGGDETELTWKVTTINGVSGNVEIFQNIEGVQNPIGKTFDYTHQREYPAPLTNSTQAIGVYINNTAENSTPSTTNFYGNNKIQSTSAGAATGVLVDAYVSKPFL